MDHLNVFRQVSKDPAAYARQWKETSKGKIVGHFCSYTPQELIVATGALPFRILNSGAEISRADAYLQAYCCSLVRGALEDALAGRLDFLDGAVFPHTCDSIQRLSDIWRLNAGFAFHADIILPVKLNTESASEYMYAVLKRFKSELKTALDVDISDEMLRKAIQTCNRVRKSLRRLYAISRKNPTALSRSDLHAVARAALVMDRNELADRLEAMAVVLEDPSAPAPAPAKRLILSGGLCNMPDVYQVVETSGGRVVWDDFCSGGRYHEGRVDETGDPLQALTRHYSTRSVCPAKHSGLFDRGRHLVDKVRTHQADGVIFMLLKFCDPHGFDYPYMKKMLDDEGIASVLVEVDDQASGQGQLKTRIEAFMEML